MIFSAAIVATVLAYTWVVAPIAPRWSGTVAAAVVLALALAHAARTRDWGLGAAAFPRSLRLASLFTAIAAVGIGIAGWRLGTWHVRPEVWRDAVVLVPWALGQQFALQTTLLHDARSVASRRAAIVLAALAFAALHLPNPFLTAATFGAALAWCWIY